MHAADQYLGLPYSRIYCSSLALRRWLLAKQAEARPFLHIVKNTQRINADVLLCLKLIRV